MDAMADVQLTLNESTEDWMRNDRMEGGGGAVRLEGWWVGGGQKGNGAAACWAAMITN